MNAGDLAAILFTHLLVDDDLRGRRWRFSRIMSLIGRQELTPCDGQAVPTVGARFSIFRQGGEVAILARARLGPHCGEIVS